MNSYHLQQAFAQRLKALSIDGKTIDPDEVFDSTKGNGVARYRRGFLLNDAEEFAGFGNGRNSRVTGVYQIDLWVLRTANDGLKVLKGLSDAHLAHFYPANGRGLTLTEGATSANILKRPTQRYFGRDGAYLRELVEVPFYVEIPAAG